MTSPFGKFDSAPQDEGTAWPAPQPAPAGYAPSSVPAYAASSAAAHIDGVGADIANLLVPGEPVLASISLKKGDLTITPKRILIQQRDSSLGNDKATWVIQRQHSVSMVWAKAVDSGVAFLATLLILGGLGAGWSSQGGNDGFVFVALVMILAGVLGFVLAMRAAIAVDAGSARASLRVETSERTRAAAFFAAATALMADV